MEASPEITTKQRNLLFLVGYYTLMLESLKLAPEWREAYEDRIKDIQLEIEQL